MADPVLCVFRERAKRCGEEYDMCMLLELDSNLSFGIRIGRSRGNQRRHSAMNDEFKE